MNRQGWIVADRITPSLMTSPFPRVANIKFFGRHKTGSIRDGVILSVQEAKRERAVSRRLAGR
jgi:hypothetical protein